MSTLHIGTKDVEAVLALLPNDVTVTEIQLDQWEEWSEPREEDRQYSGVHHIAIAGQDMSRYLTDVGFLLDVGAPLEYMRGPEYQRGTIASITHDGDWSEEIFRVTLGWRGIEDLLDAEEAR